jgi:hypothetical protein
MHCLLMNIQVAFLFECPVALLTYEIENLQMFKSNMPPQFGCAAKCPRTRHIVCNMHALVFEPLVSMHCLLMLLQVAFQFECVVALLTHIVENPQMMKSNMRLHVRWIAERPRTRHIICDMRAHVFFCFFLGYRSL